METDGVWSIRGAQLEYPNVRGVNPVARKRTQNISPSPMQPCDDNDSVADLKISSRIVDVWIENQPGVRRALVTLARSFSWVGED